MKIVYVFGNGNTSWEEFQEFYIPRLEALLKEPHKILVCDFRGVDTMAMEWLKTRTPNVAVYHMRKRPRAFPDTFRTEARDWIMKGGFRTDNDRDAACISACTHYIAFDRNSDEKRTSGTQRNINTLSSLGKDLL